MIKFLNLKSLDPLLCKVPTQISGIFFVTSVIQEITHANNAKCYKKEFPLIP